MLAIKAPAVVVVAGVGLKGGRASGGGAVLIEEGATATFQGCDFTENRATGSNQGGAIFNRGSLTIRNSTLEGNTAQGGAGSASGGDLFSASSGVTQVGLEEGPLMAEDRCFLFGPYSGGPGCAPRIRFPRP